MHFEKNQHILCPAFEKKIFLWLAKQVAFSDFSLVKSLVPHLRRNVTDI